MLIVYFRGAIFSYPGPLAAQAVAYLLGLKLGPSDSSWMVPGTFED